MRVRDALPSTVLGSRFCDAASRHRASTLRPSSARCSADRSFRRPRHPRLVTFLLDNILSSCSRSSAAGCCCGRALARRRRRVAEPARGDAADQPSQRDRRRRARREGLRDRLARRRPQHPERALATRIARARPLQGAAGARRLRAGQQSARALASVQGRRASPRRTRSPAASPRGSRRRCRWCRPGREVARAPAKERASRRRATQRTGARVEDAAAAAAAAVDDPPPTWRVVEPDASADDGGRRRGRA